MCSVKLIDCTNLMMKIKTEPTEIKTEPTEEEERTEEDGDFIPSEIVQNEFEVVCDLSFEQYPQLKYIVSNMINDIQSKQEIKVEKRIKEFIHMEQLVFTQDKVVYQRLTDYVPMLVTLFMLKDAAKILRHQMTELRNGADVVKLLSEDSERGRKRTDLKQCLERLTQAQNLISSRL